MSCGIAVWHSKKRLTNAEAYSVYSVLAENDTGEVEPHPNVHAFFNDLQRRYPDMENLFEISASDAHVLLSIPWSRAQELIDVIQSLGIKHELLCFDPQDSVILTQAV